MSRGLLTVISLAVGLVAAVLAVAILIPGDEDPAAPASEKPATHERAPATGRDDTGRDDTGRDDTRRDEFLSGFNLTAYTKAGYARPEVEDDLARLKELGSNTVVLVPTWYMKRGDSNRVIPDPAKTPDDAGLSQTIASARESGLKVMVKPHVDVLDGTFRGDIQPSDRVAWFRSYGRFIDRYAKIAAAGDAEFFSIGTELKSLSSEKDAWDSVIDSARSRFGGELTYSANWDEIWQVQFWDRLDMIGVDAYFPLSQEGEKPTPGSLASAWQPNVDGLGSLSDQWNLPVLLTEIGYPSQTGSTAHPWEVRDGDPADQNLQAMAYRAAYDAVAGKSWLRGILWWSWRADSKTDERLELDYTPEGKRAESVFSSGADGQ